MTICHEKGDVRWTKCQVGHRSHRFSPIRLLQELVIGRVRTTPNFNGPDADIVSILPFPGSYLQFAHDDRYAQNYNAIFTIYFQNRLSIRRFMGFFSAQIRFSQ